MQRFYCTRRERGRGHKCVRCAYLATFMPGTCLLLLLMERVRTWRTM